MLRKTDEIRIRVANVVEFGDPTGWAAVASACRAAGFRLADEYPSRIKRRARVDPIGNLVNARGAVDWVFADEMIFVRIFAKD